MGRLRETGHTDAPPDMVVRAARRRRELASRSGVIEATAGPGHGDGRQEAAVVAGTLAGIAGLGVFLLVHQLWIAPIWFVAPIGALVAGLGGAAVGASYATLRPHLPRPPWTVIGVAALFAAMLAPAILLAEARGPMFAMGDDGGGTLLVPPMDALLEVLVGLIAVSALTGAVIGALVGRSRRAAGVTLLAAVALAVGPGHNIPLLGATPAVGKELAILAAVLSVAAVVLVETEARLAHRHAAATAHPRGLVGASIRHLLAPSVPVEKTDVRH